MTVPCSFPCPAIQRYFIVYGRIVPRLINVGFSRDQEGRLVGAERVELCISVTFASSDHL